MLRTCLALGPVSKSVWASLSVRVSWRPKNTCFWTVRSHIDRPGLCGGFPHGDPEAGSLLSQADPVCYMAFQEDDAFREGSLHSLKCCLAC